jgi:hypothetical protein
MNQNASNTAVALTDAQPDPDTNHLDASPTTPAVETNRAEAEEAPRGTTLIVADDTLLKATTVPAIGTATNPHGVDTIKTTIEVCPLNSPTTFRFWTTVQASFTATGAIGSAPPATTTSGDGGGGALASTFMPATPDLPGSNISAFTFEEKDVAMLPEPQGALSAFSWPMYHLTERQSCHPEYLEYGWCF